MAKMVMMLFTTRFLDSVFRPVQNTTNRNTDSCVSGWGTKLARQLTIASRCAARMRNRRWMVADFCFSYRVVLPNISQIAAVFLELPHRVLFIIAHFADPSTWLSTTDFLLDAGRLSKVMNVCSSWVILMFLGSKFKLMEALAVSLWKILNSNVIGSVSKQTVECF